MKLVCPVCAARYDIEAALNDEHARVAIATAAALPAELGTLALAYVGLFRSAGRALEWRRAARLLGEVAAMVSVGNVQRAKASVPATVADWRVAMEQMLAARERLRLPLGGHGYLKQIVFASASKRVEMAKDGAARARGAHPPQSPFVGEGGSGRNREPARSYNPGEIARANPLFREVLRRSGELPEGDDEPNR